jgi:O-succinylbenzoic acid--CoA ligase
MGKFILENREYSFEEIKNGNWKESDHYFHQTFTFCQQWLKGKETFSIATSGSTGVPKSISIHRSQMKVSAETTGKYFKIEHDSKLLCCLNTWMIAGKMMLVRGMEWNATVYLVKANSDPLHDDFLKFPLDFVAMVPLQVRASLDKVEGQVKLKQIKTLIIGGAPINQKLKDDIKSSNLNAFQTYGMTETVSHIALADLRNEDLIYKTLPEVQIGLDKENKLWIKAPMSANQVVQTNDLVEILNESQFKWLGRADFVINSAGVKVYPEQVEEKIQEPIQKQFGDTNFFIAGIPDEKLGQKVSLLLETAEPENFDPESFDQELRKYINRFHVPRRYFFLKDFIYTKSGKINRPETLNKIL